MAVKTMSEQELYSELRAGKFRPCYFFYGKDVATLENVVRKLVKKLVPDEAKDLNYHFFPADGFDLSEFADAASSLPVFADRCVAAVNDLNAENLRADDLKYLEKVISDIDPDTTSAIFYATGVDLCGGKKTLSAKNSKLAEYIAKSGGAAVEFGYKSPKELVKYIQSRAASGGCEISYNAAVTLAESCLSNVMMINNELDKLSAYCDGREIKEEDIGELVSGQIDADAYKLARAVSSGDRKTAFRLLSELYSRQTEGIALLAVIGGAFLDLYRAKLALISGRGERDIAADFQYKGREFAIRNALRDSASISVERLRYCLSVLSECDADMKSKKTDQRILLETAIVKMMG